MNKVSELWKNRLSVISMGLESFTESMAEQGAATIQVDWKPPAGGDTEMVALLDALIPLKEKIDAANSEALERMISSQPVLVDVRPARDAVPGLGDNMILHAGPPVAWKDMCGPVRGAVMGALIYEGRAATLEEAEKLASGGEIEFSPCHDHGAVGPMAGVISPSMWVFCIKNETYGNMAFATLNEGLGKVLRFGAYGPGVIEKLKWMEKTLAPALAKAVKESGGINIKSIISQALMMGDECHNRNVAATSLLLRTLTPALLATDLDKETIRRVFEFITGNDHFFLNLSMPACKATADTIKGLEYSTLMCAMARNGTEIGIRVAGLGDAWFTAPAGEVKGLYFPGYSEKDACLDLGDSTITETAAIGGFAMASAPAIVKFVGGVPADAVRFTKQMYEICAGEHRDFQLPVLDFRGTPAGVDIRRVIETGIAPFINTGVAHREPGIGQIGAGLLRADMKCFRDALKAFVEKYASQ